jgi:DNA polymerase V
MKSMAHGIKTGKTTGFASPAQGYENTNIDLNELLIENPSASYLFRLETSDMADVGLPKGAILIVDRSKKPQFNQFALLRHEGQFLCRLMVKRNGKTVFTDGVTEILPVADETEIVGTVTFSIQAFNHDIPY